MKWELHGMVISSSRRIPFRLTGGGPVSLEELVRAAASEMLRIVILSALVAIVVMVVVAGARL